MASDLSEAFKKLVNEKRIPGIGAIVIDKTGKLLYNEAFGTVNANDNSAPAFTNDTELIIFSCTKMITSLCALQLIEQSSLSLDDPVGKFLPDVAEIQVYTGLDDKGKPLTRPRETEMKIVHLLTHTSGITYDFLEQNKFMYDYRMSKGQVAGDMLGVSAEWQYKDLFLGFDPGARYDYGQNLDIMGFIIEEITGLSLQDYIAKNIAQPLNLKHMGPLFSSDDANSRMAVHVKTPEGVLVAVPAIVPTKTPWKYGGGHFLITTLNDYVQVLLALLNDGTHPGTGNQILKPETVREYVFKDFFPEVGCSPDGVGHFTKSLTDSASNAGDVAQHLNISDKERGHSCAFLLNNSDVPGYRNASSGAWAGLSNLYYWVDKTAGKAGMIGTNVIPFLDQDVLGLFEKVEKFAYAS